MRLDVSSEPASAAAELIARRLRAAVRARGSASLAVSGGSTAPPMLQTLGAALASDPDLATAVTVWQVDERIAPDGDPGRNASQLKEFPCLVRIMPVTSTDLRAAARRYAASLPAVFDVVHLGMGDDGHTASWPPDQPNVATSARPVELTEEFHGLCRMTLTAHVVNAARSRIVLACGASKRPMMERWLGNPNAPSPTSQPPFDPPPIDRSPIDQLPIHRLRRAGTAVFVDEAAAPLHAAR